MSDWQEWAFIALIGFSMTVCLGWKLWRIR